VCSGLDHSVVDSDLARAQSVLGCNVGHVASITNEAQIAYMLVFPARFNLDLPAGKGSFDVTASVPRHVVTCRWQA
jgi:hypothetical protein